MAMRCALYRLPMSNRSSSVRRTTGQMQRRSRKRHCDQPCALWQSRVHRRRAACCPSGLNRWRPNDRPFRTHQCLVRQRTQLINALRGHLAEFGVIAPKGPAGLKLLANALVDEVTDQPDPVREMGQTDIRRLLIVGTMSVVRKGGNENRWLEALVARKPKMVAAVALANKMARMIWAVTTKQEDYRMA